MTKREEMAGSKQKDMEATFYGYKNAPKLSSIWDCQRVKETPTPLVELGLLLQIAIKLMPLYCFEMDEDVLSM